MHRLLLCGLLSVLAACGTTVPEGAVFGDSPKALTGFLSTTDEAQVLASASFDSHEEVFDTDLVEDVGILPIRVTVQRRVADVSRMELMQVVEDTLDHRLVLADGTILKGVQPGRVKQLVDDSDTSGLIDEHRLPDGLLDANTKFEGYLFFALPRSVAEEVSIVDGQVFHRRGTVVYPLEIQDSVLAFVIQSGDSAELEFFVGVGI